MATVRSRTPTPRAPGRALALPAVLAVLAVLVGSGLLAGCRVAAPSETAPDAAGIVAASARPEVAAARIFAAWDAARAAAWAADDATALAAVYTDPRAARADLSALARWHSRGLRVDGLRTQVLGLRVRAASPDRYRLEVHARIADTARFLGAGTPPDGVRLPHDTARTRVVVLVRAGGVWRVERISETPAPSR